MFFNDLENVMNNFTTTGGFLTASIEDKVNTMTISWGFIGLFWRIPTFVIGVRPQRYTKEFIDSSKSFTISIPFDKMKEELRICGTKSGRDINKSQLVNFVKAKNTGGYVVEGCDAYYECNILTDTLISEMKLSESISKDIYRDKDFHQIYFGEIVERY